MTVNHEGYRPEGSGPVPRPGEAFPPMNTSIYRVQAWLLHPCSPLSLMFGVGWWPLGPHKPQDLWIIERKSQEGRNAMPYTLQMRACRHWSNLLGKKEKPSWGNIPSVIERKFHMITGLAEFMFWNCPIYSLHPFFSWTASLALETGKSCLYAGDVNVVVNTGNIREGKDLGERNGNAKWSNFWFVKTFCWLPPSPISFQIG